MNYAWEAALQRQSNPAALPLSFVPSHAPGPYMEITQEDVNHGLEGDENTLEINAWYRFNHIFASLLDSDMQRHSQLQIFIFDVFMQWITQMDLCSGLYKQKYCSMFIEKDIRNAVFGLKSSDIFRTFSAEQQKTILVHLVKLYAQGSSIPLLKSLMQCIFTHVMLYLDEGTDLLLYIGKKQTDVLQVQVNWLCDSMIPIDYTLHLFWDMHFGIIGVESTMEIDEIMLY